MNAYEKVQVSNGLFMLALFDSTHSAYYKNYKLKIVEDCIDEDWKTFVAKKKDIIPEGTIFNEYSLFRNLYGLFFDVSFNTHRYSIDPKYVELIKK